MLKPAEIKMMKPKLDVIKEDEIPHLLLPGELGAILELTVKDKDGKITDHRIMKSKSFVRQLLELLWVQFYSIGEFPEYQLRDITNTLHYVASTCYLFSANAGAGITTYGIVVGTDGAAPTINDYHLGALIAHGVGAGQLQYSAVTFGAPASDATTSQFTITRDFANGSGAGITVNEIGLYVYAGRYITNFSFMTIRDVIAGGILVPNGQTLTVNYRPQVVA